MDTLKGADRIKCVDLRNTLGISAATMHNDIKKLGFSGSGRVITGGQARKILEKRGYRYPEEAFVISFLICKGGTAKSSSAFFVGQRLASYGAKVLLVDSDPQGNLTAAFKLDQYGISLTPESPVLADVLDKKISVCISDAIISVTENLFLLPSTPVNSKTDSVIRQNYKNPAIPLKKSLDIVKNNFDYIIIDCAPALNITNTAAIGASKLVILPVDPCLFSENGLQQTLDEISDIRDECQIKNDILTRIFLTKYDERQILSVTFLAELMNSRPNMMFKSLVRTSSDIRNVISTGTDLFTLTKSRARKDYDDLSREIMGLDSFLQKKQ